MTVSERIPFSGLLLPLQKGYSYSCDRRTQPRLPDARLKGARCRWICREQYCPNYLKKKNHYK